MLMFADWHRILNSVLNICLVSVPEELFLVLFSLILLRQFDFLESKNEGTSRVKKRDVIEVIAVVLVLAILSNILDLFDINANIKVLLLVVLMPSLVVMVYRLWTLEGVVKTFLYCLCSIMLFLLIEMLTVFLIMKITNKTVEALSESALLCFIWSLPERVVELLIVVYLLVKKMTFLKANVVRTIVQGKMLTLVVMVFFAFNIIVFTLLGKLILFDGILIEMNFLLQLLIIACVLMFPVINIMGIFWAIYFVSNKEQYEKYIAKETLKNMTDELLLLAQNKKFEKMEFVLKDIQINVEDLYKE